MSAQCRLSLRLRKYRCTTANGEKAQKRTSANRGVTETCVETRYPVSKP